MMITPCPMASISTASLRRELGYDGNVVPSGKRKDSLGYDGNVGQRGNSEEAEVHKTQPLAAHGEIGNGRKEKSRDDKITSTRGSTGQAYLLRRLARDAPDVLERVKTGEIKSARAAAIEAGIIIPFPSLQLKDSAPTAEELLAINCKFRS